ncbi:hypothetical protein [Azospira restricta]|uniref:hypothetical protein n=1 Tax=Azospira restricta TaxID=404405 RepID=UPI001EEFB405|nr:hypothetical protein [Azospira restricta]
MLLPAGLAPEACLLLIGRALRAFTAVPRSLAAAASPAIGGALFAAGWLAAPLVACGALKIAYDVALWRAFRRHGETAS